MKYLQYLRIAGKAVAAFSAGSDISISNLESTSYSLACNNSRRLVPLYRFKNQKSRFKDFNLYVSDIDSDVQKVRVFGDTNLPLNASKTRLLACKPL